MKVTAKSSPNVPSAGWISAQYAAPLGGGIFWTGSSDPATPNPVVLRKSDGSEELLSPNTAAGYTPGATWDVTARKALPSRANQLQLYLDKAGPKGSLLVLGGDTSRSTFGGVFDCDKRTWGRFVRNAAATRPEDFFAPLVGFVDGFVGYASQAGRIPYNSATAWDADGDRGWIIGGTNAAGPVNIVVTIRRKNDGSWYWMDVRRVISGPFNQDWGRYFIRCNACYVPGRGVYLFGGVWPTSGTNFTGLWRMNASDVTKWTVEFPGGKDSPPAPSGYCLLLHIPELNALMLFGNGPQENNLHLYDLNAHKWTGNLNTGSIDAPMVPIPDRDMIGTMPYGYYDRAARKAIIQTNTPLYYEVEFETADLSAVSVVSTEIQDGTCGEIVFLSSTHLNGNEIQQNLATDPLPNTANWLVPPGNYPKWEEMVALIYPPDGSNGEFNKARIATLVAGGYTVILSDEDGHLINIPG